MNSIKDFGNTIKLVISASFKDSAFEVDKDRKKWINYFLIYLFLGYTGLHYFIGKTNKAGLIRLLFFTAFLTTYFLLDYPTVPVLILNVMGFIYLFDLYMFIRKDGANIKTMPERMEPAFWLKVFFFGLWLCFVQIVVSNLHNIFGSGIIE